MPKTIINVPADIVASAPETSSSDDPAKQTTTDPGKTNNTDKTNKTETKDTSSAKSANTGFLTKDASSSSLSSGDIAPIAFGSIFFVGIIILCATIVKLRLRRINSNYALKKRQTSRILGVFSGLMMLVGLGGLAGSIFSSSAINMPVEDITTSNVVNAKLVDYSDTYKLYCGIDTITFNKATRNGWVLRAYGENNATLTSKDSKNTNIASIDDWKELPVGSWGFKTDHEFYEELTEKNQYKPINLGNGVIAQSTEASETGDAVNVTYCAKVDAKTVGDFTATINYEAELNGVSERDLNAPLLMDNGLFSYVDYDSPEDEDGDEMTNREENRYGLDPMNADTDFDGLFDSEELKVFNTNPLDDDSDNDSLIDYSEVVLELDPINPKTDGETLDNERETLYVYDNEETGIKVEITGTGNTPIFTADAFNDSPELEESEENEIENEEPENILSSLLNFYTEGEVNSATITLNYTDEQLAESGLTEDNMAIYYVDEDNGTETKVDTEIDTGAKTITATVDHFSKYRVRNASEEEYPIIDVGEIEEPADNGASPIGGGSASTPTIIKSTKNAKLNYDGDNKKDTVIADSKFRSDVHGFKFRNYTTNLSDGGSCAGMARFAERRFMKTLPTSTIPAVTDYRNFFSPKTSKRLLQNLTMSKKDKDLMRSYAFNLSGTNYINYNQDLSSIALTTDTLKYTLDFKWSDFGQTYTSGLYGEQNAKYYDSIGKIYSYLYDSEDNTNLDYTTNEFVSGSILQPVLYKKLLRRSYYVTSIDNINKNGASIDSEDKEILNAIQYYQWTQLGDQYYMSGAISTSLPIANLIISVKDSIKLDTRALNNKTFIKTLTKYLNDGDPVVIGMSINQNGNSGGHAVNATRLIQSGANANIYYLEVYDNNYPGETMTITLDCKLLSCQASTLGKNQYRNANSNGTKPEYILQRPIISMDFASDRNIQIVK